MNVFLRTALSIGSIMIGVCAYAMDATAHRIEKYNKCNSDEIRIDSSEYLKWLAQDTPAQNDETIIHTMTQTFAARLCHYGYKPLKPLWRTLKTHADSTQLNNLLDIIIAQTGNDHYYNTKKRFLIALCVCAGADANLRRTQDNLNALGEAVLHNDTAAAQLLLDHGANPNTYLTYDLQAPIIWYAGTQDMIELLIRHGAYLPHLTGTLSECDQEWYDQLRALFVAHKQGRNNN
jgi:hypothetical protein